MDCAGQRDACRHARSAVRVRGEGASRGKARTVSHGVTTNMVRRRFDASTRSTRHSGMPRWEDPGRGARTIRPCGRRRTSFGEPTPAAPPSTTPAHSMSCQTGRSIDARVSGGRVRSFSRVSLIASTRTKFNRLCRSPSPGPMSWHYRGPESPPLCHRRRTRFPHRPVTWSSSSSPVSCSSSTCTSVRSAESSSVCPLNEWL